MASTPDGHGYWLVGADGGVYAFGDAPFEGSIPQLGLTLVAPIVGMAPTQDGRGYWLMGADGALLGPPSEFAFGDALYCSSGQTAPLGVFSPPPGFVTGIAPVVAASDNTASVGRSGFSETDGVGEVLLVPAPGDPCSASWPGSGSGAALPSNVSLSAQISAEAMSGDRVWLAAVDGGVFALSAGSQGQTPFYGSLPGMRITPQGPIVDVVATPSGEGYWLLGADGGIFAFGDAPFYGSAVRE